MLGLIFRQFSVVLGEDGFPLMSLSFQVHLQMGEKWNTTEKMEHTGV
jgi:hypothetical protein